MNNDLNQREYVVKIDAFIKESGATH